MSASYEYVAINFTHIFKNKNIIVETHNQLVRTSLESCGGYEISNSGSSFLGAFPTLQAALDWSFTIHTTLLHAQWPKQLLTLPAYETIIVIITMLHVLIVFYY